MKRGYIRFLSLITALFLLGGTGAKAQIESGDSNPMLQGKPASGWFEGSLKYYITVTGKYAMDFLANEPPNRLDMHIKEDNFIIHLSGGMKPKTFLFIGDSNHTYIVDLPNRRYFLRDYYIDTTEAPPMAKPTGKVEVVGRYTCQEYKIESKNRITLLYVNDDIRVDPAWFNDKPEAKADFTIPGLDGRIPLKKIIKEPGLTTTMEVNVVDRKELPGESFAIPEGFKKRIRDPRG